MTRHQNGDPFRVGDGLIHLPVFETRSRVRHARKAPELIEKTVGITTKKLTSTAIILLSVFVVIFAGHSVPGWGRANSCDMLKYHGNGTNCVHYP